MGPMLECRANVIDGWLAVLYVERGRLEQDVRF
jgi:hypothetical protein